MSFKTVLVICLFSTLVISSLSTLPMLKYYLQGISDSEISKLSKKVPIQPEVKVYKNSIVISQKCTVCTCPTNIRPYKFSCIRKGCSSEEIKLEKTLVRVLLFDKLASLLKKKTENVEDEDDEEEDEEDSKPFRIYAKRGYFTFGDEPSTWPPRVIYGPRFSFSNAGSSSSSQVSMNSGTSNFASVGPGGVNTGSKAGTNGNAGSNTNSYGNMGGYGIPNTSIASNSGSQGKLNSNTGSNSGTKWGYNFKPITTAGSQSQSGGNMGSGGGSNAYQAGGWGVPALNAQSGSNSGGNLGSSTGSSSNQGPDGAGANSGSNSKGNMGSNSNGLGGLNGYGFNQNSNTNSGSGGNIGSVTGSGANLGMNEYGIPTINAGSNSNTNGNGGSNTSSSNNQQQQRSWF